MVERQNSDPDTKTERTGIAYRQFKSIWMIEERMAGGIVLIRVSIFIIPLKPIEPSEDFKIHISVIFIKWKFPKCERAGSR
jgi:hypothetical protein